MGAGLEFIPDIERGMVGAIRAGLIDIRAGGKVFVHDYLEHQTPGDNAGRLRSMHYRDQKRRGDAQ